MCVAYTPSHAPAIPKEHLSINEIITGIDTDKTSCGSFSKSLIHHMVRTEHLMKLSSSQRDSSYTHEEARNLLPSAEGQGQVNKRNMKREAARTINRQITMIAALAREAITRLSNEYIASTLRMRVAALK